MHAAPFPKGGGTVLLRYDYWNLCVRSFGEPSPESPIRGGGGGWEIGLKGPPPGVAMDPRPCVTLQPVRYIAFFPLSGCGTACVT